MELIHLLSKLCGVRSETFPSAPITVSDLCHANCLEVSSNKPPVLTHEKALTQLHGLSPQGDTSHLCVNVFSHNYPNSCILMISLGNNCQWLKHSQLISPVNNVLPGFHQVKMNLSDPSCLEWFLGKNEWLRLLTLFRTNTWWLWHLLQCTCLGIILYTM